MGHTEFKPGWFPLWCWHGFEDCIEDPFEPLEEADTDAIKRSPDQCHEPVPQGKDEHWDEPKDVDDPLDDWPDEVPEEHNNEPVDAPKPVMEPKEEACNEPLD